MFSGKTFDQNCLNVWEKSRFSWEDQSHLTMTAECQGSYLQSANHTNGNSFTTSNLTAIITYRWTLDASAANTLSWCLRLNVCRAITVSLKWTFGARPRSYVNNMQSSWSFVAWLKTTHHLQKSMQNDCISTFNSSVYHYIYNPQKRGLKIRHSCPSHTSF